MASQPAASLSPALSPTRAVQGARPDATLSSAIQIARVLAIFAMMWVHAGPNADVRHLHVGAMAGQDWVAVLLVDVLGRSSVPLLTIVSGYLAVTAARRAWLANLRHKASTLLVPMLAWNALFAAVGLAAAALTGAAAFEGRPGLAWHDAFLALTDAPLAVPLAFLRDLFVCAALLPALVLAMRLAPAATVGLAFAFAVLDPAQPVLLRPQILFFFMLGIGFAQGWRIPRPGAPMAMPATALAVLAVATHFLLRHAAPGALPHPAPDFFSNLARLGVAFLFWRAAMGLAARPLGQRIARAEPYVFIAFCSHFLLFRILGALPIDPDGAVGFALFLAQPALALLAAWAIVAVLARACPPLLAVLNAGRAPARTTRGDTPRDARHAGTRATTT